MRGIYLKVCRSVRLVHDTMLIMANFGLAMPQYMEWIGLDQIHVESIDWTGV